MAALATTARALIARAAFAMGFVRATPQICPQH